MKWNRVSAIFLAAAPVLMASWTDPHPATQVFYNLGCGADSGKSIQNLTVGGNTYILKTGSPIFRKSVAAAAVSVADQIPLQVFTLAAQTGTDFSYRADDGSCQTKSAVEVLGVSLDRQIQTTGIRGTRVIRSSIQHLSRNRLLLSTDAAFQAVGISGRRVEPAEICGSSGRILDFSALPVGTYVVRSGKTSLSFTKF